MVRLLLAFLVVSVLPIGLLAFLSLQEEHPAQASATPSVEATAKPATRETGGEAGETGGETHQGETAADTHPAESFMGIPIATLELGVAGVSLVLSVVMAIYIGRTIVRPIQSLGAAMGRVESGDLEARAPTTSDDEIGRLAGAFNRMVVGLRREALIRDLFGQYVTPEVARVAIESEGRLEAQQVECSILFADIRGFTALAEVLPAYRLIGTLNGYLEAMLREVAAEGGIVTKFGGDSILAVFGSPLNPGADHAARAVRAAVRMRTALADFNRRQVEGGLPEIQAGIGIATGDVVAGNVGSERKIEYTVIGDAVNLAARLEELTRQLGAPILVADSTARAASEAADVAAFEPLGRHEIRGRAEPIEVYAAKG